MYFSLPNLSTEQKKNSQKIENELSNTQSTQIEYRAMLKYINSIIRLFSTVFLI
jgi:hypothetical protein